jgi:hypothetical protein
MQKFWFVLARAVASSFATQAQSVAPAAPATVLLHGNNFAPSASVDDTAMHLL